MRKYSKYGAKKTVFNGVTFDSKREADRYCALLLAQKCDIIGSLRLQVPYELVPKQEGERAVVYRADFVYTDLETGETIVEDAKGYKTPEYIIKRKLMLWRYGIKIHEV